MILHIHMSALHIVSPYNDALLTCASGRDLRYCEQPAGVMDIRKVVSRAGIAAISPRGAGLIRW